MDVTNLIVLAGVNITIFQMKDLIYKKQGLSKSICEKQIGLDMFKKINGRDYTKEEFDNKLNKCFQYEDHTKYPTENLKNNALQKQKQLQKAKEFIYQLNGWEK